MPLFTKMYCAVVLCCMICVLQQAVTTKPRTVSDCSEIGHTLLQVQWRCDDTFAQWWMCMFCADVCILLSISNEGQCGPGLAASSWLGWDISNAWQTSSLEQGSRLVTGLLWQPASGPQSDQRISIVAAVSCIVACALDCCSAAAFSFSSSPPGTCLTWPICTTSVASLSVAAEVVGCILLVCINLYLSWFPSLKLQLCCDRGTVTVYPVRDTDVEQGISLAGNLCTVCCFLSVSISTRHADLRNFFFYARLEH